MKSRGRDKLEIEQYPFYTIRIKNRKLDTRKFRIIGGEGGIAVSIGSNIRDSDALNDETFRRDRRASRETRSRKGKVEGRRGTMSHEREKERKRRRRRRIGQSCFRAACNSLHWQTNKRENRQEEMKRI